MSSNNKGRKPTRDEVTRRIEGIAIWAIPGIDLKAADEDLPDRIPDKALEQMRDRYSGRVKADRGNSGKN